MWNGAGFREHLKTNCLLCVPLHKRRFWYVLPRLQEPGTCCGLVPRCVRAGSAFVHSVFSLSPSPASRIIGAPFHVAQTGIEPVASRSQSEPSTADLLRYFAAVLPSLSTYSKATKDCDLRHCKDKPFFVPRKSSGRENAGVGRKETGKPEPRGLPPRPTHAALAAGFGLAQQPRIDNHPPRAFKFYQHVPVPPPDALAVSPAYCPAGLALERGGGVAVA